MPFTPFHLGPGAAFKAMAGRYFSFMIFGGSQVLMDVEPLVRMIRGDTVVHGPSHTILGALVIGVVSAVVGRPVSDFFLKRLRISDRPITWTVAFASAFVGTYSHVALDAIMHSDMAPFWPLVAGNGFLGALSLDVLHVLCVVLGVLGTAAILLVALLSRRRSGAEWSDRTSV